MASGLDKPLTTLTFPLFVAVPLLLLWWLHRKQWLVCDQALHRVGVAVRSCCAHCAGTPASPVSGSAPEFASPSRVGAATASLCLYLFSSILQTLLSLLQCTSITDSDLRLLIAPDEVQCFTDWQRALIAVMSVLVLCPFVLGGCLVARHSASRARLFVALADVREAEQQQKSASAGSDPGQSLVSPLIMTPDRSAASRNGQFGAAVWRALTYPYVSHSAVAMAWEAVRLSHRLICVMCFTFILEPVPRVMGVVAFTGALAFAQECTQPFRERLVARYSTFTLCALVFVGVCNLPQAVTEQNASIMQRSLSLTTTALLQLEAALLILPFAVTLLTLFASCAFASRKQDDSSAHLSGINAP